MSREAQARRQKELKKLKMMSPMSASDGGAKLHRLVLSLPWEDKTQDKLDVKEAERILDEDHYGLQKIKERILEYLAVQALVRKLKGRSCAPRRPPGVGKTLPAKSTAVDLAALRAAAVAGRGAR